MLRQEKEKIIDDLKEKVARAKAMYFADFSGITVEQVNNLRREFKKAKIDYKVVKNTLIKKALESVSGYDDVYDRLVGPTSIAFGYDDPVVPAKIIKKFNEKNEIIKVKAFIVEKVVFPGKELDVIANIPSRPELIASMLGSIQAPISGVVGTINAVMRDLVNVIDAIEKKKSA